MQKPCEEAGTVLELNTFESGEFLQLPAVAQAEARGALPLVLFDRCLGSRLLPLQQLSGGRDTVAGFPVGALQKREKKERKKY